MQVTAYDAFLKTVTAPQWKRLGLQRRAGVCTPLFSIYSSQSIGIGEFPDLERLAQWCRRSGMSIIQLLPLNDTAFRFTPYDSASTFALDPVYLSLEKIADISADNFKKDIEKLRSEFPAGGKRVNYAVKKAKLKILKRMFDARGESPAFKRYVKENAFWLENYALYKAIKDERSESGWESWEGGLRGKEKSAVENFYDTHKDTVLFHQWVQWQAFEQARAARQACLAQNVFLMGDLPFLVSRDSADVWSNQGYFKLHRVSGAPPDAFFANGQRWGMPPYDWPEIEKHGYDYVVRKVRYAQNFYDLFRIDHVVGTFRLWTIRSEEPEENGGLNGVFDPSDENLWEEHGRKILSVMIQASDMLPCAEDLGVVPPCSYKVLEELGVPGMDVQRWTRDWKTDYGFTDPARYRANSMAVISNHDMTSFRGWWAFEAETVDEALFKRRCRECGVDYEKVKNKLFDFERSAHGRLRWKQDISDESVLAWNLEKPAQEIFTLTALYRESFGEKKKFLEYAGLNPEQSLDSAVLFEAALKKADQTASIFSIQLLQDLLSMKNGIEEDPWNYRINFPGTMGEQNWSLAVPWSLEKMLSWQGNELIREIHRSADRI